MTLEWALEGEVFALKKRSIEIPTSSIESLHSLLHIVTKMEKKNPAELIAI